MATKSSKTPIYLIVGGIALAIFLGMRAAPAYAAARFSVSNIKAKIDAWTLQGVRLLISLNIQNDSGVAIPVDSFMGRIRYGSTILAPINLANPVTINSGGMTTLQFQTVISYAGLAANIQELIQSGNFIGALMIDGVLTAGGVSVPVQKNLIAIG